MGSLPILTLACLVVAIAGGIALGRNSSVEGRQSHLQARTPFGRLKEVVESGQWSLAVPPILVLGGMCGCMLFGALTLIFVFGQTRGGWPMLAVAVLTIAWVTWEYARAKVDP